jgi:dTDP-glucose 4,6-dehydratase
MSNLGGRRVLVTGAGGFIGAHLVERLVLDGAKPRAFVRYNSRNDRGALEWLPSDVLESVEVVAGDLRDVESVTQAVVGMDVVFHLGAQIAIPYSYVNPRDFFETNVLGSLNVAQASLAAGVSRLLHTSSSEVYGTAQVLPITEDHPLDVQSPYAASKLGADKLMEAYHRTYELPVTVVRPFNTYGPFQSARAVVPTILLQAIEGDRILLGSTDPRRDLTYVTDTVAGFVRVVEEPETIGLTLQLGTGQELSVREIVDVVAEIVGHPLRIEQEPARVRPSGSEVMRLISNPERVRSLTGWRDDVDLREGLTRTLDWLRTNRRGRAEEYVT